MENDSGVVYSSGVVIADESLITTLAICYERIYLPYSLVMGKQALLGQWHAKWNPLFEGRAIERLNSCPPDMMGELEQEHQLAANAMLEKYVLGDRNLGDQVNVVNAEDLILHLARTDITLPQIFDTSATPNRHTLVGLEAFAAFHYLLPKLNALEPDDILELRRKVRDTREGFTMHLQKLSKGLDGMVKSGENLKDLSGYAQGIVETELIPDYREFHRQLAAENAGKLRKVLDVTGKIMEIDAAPWTPKFWGLLLKALGMSAIETAADQKERLTNRYQAFEFMKTIESFDQRKRGK